MTRRRNAPLLDARTARTFYNVADALIPGDAPGRGAADVDLVPRVEKELSGFSPGERRAVRRFLRWIEWQPILQGRGRHGFSWLPRNARRELLARWESSRIRARRRAVARLAGLIRGAHSPPGA